MYNLISNFNKEHFTHVMCRFFFPETITDYKSGSQPPPHPQPVVVLTYGNESKCNTHNYKHCKQGTISVSSNQCCNQKTLLKQSKK